MSSLLEIELENAQHRRVNLLKTGRDDVIARIVIARVEAEIITLKRKLKHEEKPREEINTCTSTSGTTRRIRETLYRYWVECYGNNNAIPSIPAIDTL